MRTNEKSLISPVSRPSSTPCNADKLTSTLQHLSFPFNPVTSIIISHRIPAGGQVYVSKKAPVCCFLFRLLNKFPWSIAKFITYRSLRIMEKEILGIHSFTINICIEELKVPFNYYVIKMVCRWVTQ